MKEYWLMLYQETFLWLKQKRGLLYHAGSEEKLEFYLNDSIKAACLELNELDNLYGVKVILPQDDEFNVWVDHICEKRMGGLFSVDQYPNKLVSLPPVVMVDDEKSELGYLHEITFYIGGNEKRYPDYFRQLDHPIYAEESLSIHKIGKFLNKINGYNLQKVNFVGVELLSLSDREDLINLLSIYSFKKIFIINADNIGRCADLLNNQGPSFSVICHSIEELMEAKRIIGTRDGTIKYIYVLTNESDYIALEKKGIWENVSVTPVFTKDNLAFFKDNIYINTEDLSETVLSKREIFRNQKINSHFFGKLVVMPDGKIYGSVNKPSIGTMDDSIYDLLQKEFERKDSWLYVREQAPCTGCVYQWLCPSPSNYELVIGKPNLCHYQL